MKNFRSTLLIVFVMFISNSISREIANPALRVMTFNIRLNVASDSLNAWPHRKDKVASTIRFHHVNIVGVQEALWEQVSDLADFLPEYGWIGVGRDDGDKKGEFMAVYFLKKRFNVIENATFWLSENPTRPGLGWDAACNRVVTWGKFEDKETKEIFYLFNTHFDHIGEVARRESAKLLLKYIYDIAGNSPVIVTGDFNSKPDSQPYKILTQDMVGDNNLKLINTEKISRYPHHGPGFTFTGFKMSTLIEGGSLIDYIFIKNGIIVLNHGTLSDTFDGFFPSDHMPVLTELILDKTSH